MGGSTPAGMHRRNHRGDKETRRKRPRDRRAPTLLFLLSHFSLFACTCKKLSVYCEIERKSSPVVRPPEGGTTSVNAERESINQSIKVFRIFDSDGNMHAPSLTGKSGSSCNVFIIND